MRRPRARTTEILARYIAGDNVKQLAHDHGCTTSNIYQLAGEHGARMLRTKTPMGMTSEIIALRERGFSYREIAERVPITPSGICLALKRWRPDLLARAK